MNLTNKIDVFSPYLIIFAIFLYVLFGLVGFFYQIKGLQAPSIGVYFYILFGCCFFLLGIIFPKIFYKLNFKRFKNLNNFLNQLYSQKEYLINNLNQNKSPDKSNNIKKSFFKSFSLLELVILAIVILGLSLQAINLIYSGGIPLLSGYLKAKAVTKIWIFSYLLFLPGINILLARFNRSYYYILFILGIAIFALTGYRTTTIVIILSVFITLYYTRNFSKNLKWIYFAIFIIGLVGIGLLVGYISAKSIEWQTWTLNPLELFFYRAGYTLTVFNTLIGMQGATHGTLTYYSLTGFFQAADPRAIVGEVVLGYKHSATSTIFGPALLDFGVWALALQMFFLGLILKLMHLIQKVKKGIFTVFYAIILAQTLVWIETGPTDLVVWIFYLISILLILYAYFNHRNYMNGYELDEVMGNDMKREDP
ncbi:MAG: oligosaccharide repeat unit polymerase family protein [Methanobacteriaceae archaeon]|jgi:oligosaccharide repeat unit polymerase|nr:oligosaccharide repeat unit polymerase family protein [Methanobacteriaceae archaeon]MDO9627854.1 oligosaccharide repeat unit polymerase family protein [Methanobacteriaceae archaeon]